MYTERRLSYLLVQVPSSTNICLVGTEDAIEAPKSPQGSLGLSAETKMQLRADMLSLVSRAEAWVIETEICNWSTKPRPAR